MKLYQAGYFRLGGRGSGSGWNIVAPSFGMSEIAKAGFKGIAAKLVDLKQTVQMPAEAMGVFQHDKFIYLISVNYAASGEDSRGVAYVHAYCFNLTEYFELAVHPEMLFGALPDNFYTEYQPDISAYPVVESLHYREMNERRLLDQYHISKEQYKNLILSAICALEGYSGPLCIKCTIPPEQYVKTYQEVMYLIMKGLPYHLRQKLMSFSYRGMQTMLYLSDKAQGNTYVDLDTGECRCDYSRLGAYHFTKLYNMDPFYYDRGKWELILKNIAEFVQNAFADPLKNAGCTQIEAGFQKKIKKNNGGIEPAAVVSLFDDFFKFELNYDLETAEYLAALLDTLNQNGLRITDKKLISDIEFAYRKCSAQVLLEPMALYEARRILEQKKEQGFEILLKLKNEDADDLYPFVCRHLDRLSNSFFADYYWNQFLPGELTSLKKAELYLNQDKKEFSADEQRCFLKILKNLIDDKMKKADSFDELCMTADAAARMLQNYPMIDASGKFLDDIYFILWSRFEPEWFEPERIKDYILYHVQQLANGLELRSCPNAKKVSRLISITEEIYHCTDMRKLWDLLFTSPSQEEKKLKRKIQRGYREKFFSGARNGTARELDLSLALFYDMEKKQFDFTKWIAKWSEQKDMEQFGSLLAEYGQGSELLKYEEKKVCAIQCLEDAFKNKKQTAYNRLPDDQKQALHKLYDGLKGKAGKVQKTTQLFVYSLHREVLGIFAMMSLAVCGICLQRYGSGDIIVPMLFTVFFAVALAVFFVCKAMTIESMSGLFADMGLESGLAKCLYLCVFIIFSAVAVIVFFLGDFFSKAVCIKGFLAAAGVMAAVYGLTTKE